MAKFLLFIFVSAALWGCGGGGGGDSGRSGGAGSADFDCNGSCTNLNLTIEDVGRVLSQAIAGAEQMGAAATFAVVDRVGNVLALYQMPGAAATTTINGQIGAAGGLEGLTVPSTLAAISKAGTGAYLSSQGNAFSTRTASQIVQEHFNPGEQRQPGGPLFGVQFSQLPCGDVVVSDGSMAGPRAMPLGLSADPGGIPLYKSGDMVGGIGVEFDSAYRLDRDILDTDSDPEEIVAMQASIGFEAPSKRVAPNINVGKSLRYTDLGYEELEPLPEVLPEVNSANLVVAIRAGTTFGDAASGYVRSVRAGVATAFLANSAGSARFPTRAGTGLPGGVQLSPAEVDAILDSAQVTASRARAAIRRPLDSAARVSIWVVDTQGAPLGFTRSEDAPVFGTDVALQKARTATFFSLPDAGAVLSAAGLGGYSAAAAGFLGPSALAGGNAITCRAMGNLSRPFFVDGIDGNSNGPYSLPFPGTAAGSSWSPFNTGVQLDAAFPGIAAALGGASLKSCTSSAFGRRLANGIQIFPGSVPLFRGSTLIGGLGISGDGVDQDDLIAFYGASRPGLDRAGHTTIGDPVLGFNAPKEIRSDQIILPIADTRLRYVNCPEGAFVGDNSQNVCDGL
ncbi:MAG: hypothetical protein DCC75_03975 [Proteobacteria bacterium]|nr:MAG: hypothetical protein DCC75_03975 [Pseudomonadota bacterium]